MATSEYYNLPNPFGRVEDDVGFENANLTLNTKDIVPRAIGGSFVINLAGIKVTDGAGERLQGHLSSAEFFDIAKFGEATFNISNVVYTKADKATITGDLSLHGISAPVTFNASIRSADDKGFFAEAFFPFDRTLFGISYGVGNIDSDVQLAVHIYGNK